MARYDYKCKHCGHIFEVEHSMKEKPVIHCPHCKKEAERIISTSAITFKGSGFYNTDNKASSNVKSD